MSSDLADKINRELVIWHKRETAPQACILAILYEEGGDFDKAKKFYKNAMDLDPENSEIKIKFAELSLESDVVKDVPIKGRKKNKSLISCYLNKKPFIRY